MDLKSFKLKLLDTGLFKKVSSKGQYVCKTCPFCGDTKSHMYVLIRLDDDTPVVYNCFKCPAHGLMSEEFLNYFGIDNLQIPKIQGKRRINQHNSNESVELISEERDGSMLDIARDYIQYRVGVTPSIGDLKSFQLIGNPADYLNTYLGGYCNTKNRVWFRLSNGYMIGRSYEKSENGMRWKKFTGERDYGNGIYIIRKPVDTHQTINLCIAEGVMDCIGLYYHERLNNAVYMACLGRDYGLCMMHAIRMGVFGDSVNVRIYKDSDVDFVKIKNVYQKMFKKIDIYRNSIGKDYGVTADGIEIEKCSG